jgi:hypothetical protein
MKALNWTTPESKDNTNKIIEELKDMDKNNKISVIHGLWEDKIHESNGYLNLVNDDIDYIWQLDSDELYLLKDLYTVKNYLIKEQPTYVVVKQLHFFKNFKTIAVGQSLGWGWETPQPRIQKFYKGCKYTEHRPPMIQNPITGINNNKIKSQNLTNETGVLCYHYNYVTDKQVFEKISYYASEFPQIPRLKNWYNIIWKGWDKNKEYIENSYGTHPTAWQNSRTIPYLGIHPEQMKRKINETFLDNT